jgi:hypothetical protein
MILAIQILSSVGWMGSTLSAVVAILLMLADFGCSMHKSSKSPIYLMMISSQWYLEL